MPDKITITLGGPTLRKIESIWAFLTVDPKDGVEGLCAYFEPKVNQWIPMIAADEARLDSMREKAKVLAQVQPNRIVLVRFHGREELEEIRP